MSEKHYRQLRTARAENIPATVKRIFSYLKAYKVQMVIVLICIVIGALTNVASSYFITPVIDKYVEPYIGQTNPDLTQFIRMLYILASIYLSGTIASYIWRKLMSLVTTGLLHDIRTQLFNKMQNMSVKFYDTHTHGELMNFYTNDVDTIRPLVADTFPQLISTIISVSGVIIMMFRQNLILAAIAVLSLVVMSFITYYLGKFGRKYFIQVQKNVSDINGYCEEMFQGLKVIKVFQHEEESIKEFKKYNDRMYSVAVMSNTFGGMLMPINGNLAYVTYAIIAMVGAKLAIDGNITIGTLASFLLYTRQIAGPISNLSQQFNGMMMAISGAERVFNLIDSPNEVDDGKIVLVNVVKNSDGTLTETDKKTDDYAWKNPQDNSLTELKGDIRLHNVTFSYEPNKIVLNDVSLYAKPGQKIAFVGSTGAGKTTITNLINRFYDVEQGSITYDGINIKDIKKSSLRSSLGVVLQDTNLFSGTVLENIRYGNLQATDEQCIEAAKLANADSFISRLPEGYNTMLTANGMNLSQGQRQLLNIARAAVADPPVLILDEATSSIDTHTERLIEKGMDKLMKGRTVFVIAHRLSTVRNSNAIIVLEHGQIVERGDHDDLLEQKGRYYQLYTGKAELD
ncbi:MAG: ABC transporter ATP-binding protein [Erysipelotrichia bacterium]|nr:ABC transporter ATP-binding protein [Erysipelotrichia bacterium]